MTDLSTRLRTLADDLDHHPLRAELFAEAHDIKRLLQRAADELQEAPVIRKQAREEARLERVGKIVEDRESIRKQEQKRIEERLRIDGLLDRRIRKSFDRLGHSDA